MTVSLIEQEQMKFIADLQAAKSEGLYRLIELSQSAKSDLHKIKALEALMKYASSFDPWKNV